MTTYVIEGAHPVEGKARLPGSKNAVTKMLIASLLSDEPSTLANIPDILEIDLTIGLLESIGAEIEKTKEKGVLNIRRGQKFQQRISNEQASHNRMAVLVIAPLLNAFGEVYLPKNLGGDRIGPRPVNFHLDAYRQFGADVIDADDHYHIKCDELRGANITLPYPSVSTTENILLAASMAKGTTVIKGAAVEPEVLDLVLFLQKMGAIIEQNTDRTYIIEGRKELKGARHSVLPDRITCASLGALAVATGGRIEVEGARQEHMLTFLNTLRRMGAPFDAHESGITFGNGQKTSLQPISLETDVHPGFMTDWQPPMGVLMTQADGYSVLHETVYENRLGYMKHLAEMGAKVQRSTKCLGGSACRFHNQDFNHSCIVHGPTPLQGREVIVPDLRAGFTYVIAALVAEGASILKNIEETERGYGRLDLLLNSMGAQIKREA